MELVAFLKSLERSGQFKKVIRWILLEIGRFVREGKNRKGMEIGNYGAYEVNANRLAIIQ